MSIDGVGPVGFEDEELAGDNEAMEEELWDETSPEFDSEWDAPDADVQVEGDDGEPDPQRVVEAAPRTDPNQRANNAANQKTIDEMFDFLPGPEHTGDGERLQKVLARAGVGSRRVIEDLITARRIKVNGEIAVLAAELDALHGDPADRFIAATAIQRGATLLTADTRLLAWKHRVKRQDARK